MREVEQVRDLPADDLKRIRVEGIMASLGLKLDGSPLKTLKGYTALDRWREENPDAFQTWETTNGCVIQFWRVRVYYGRCTRCDGLVTHRRKLHKHQKRRTWMGRWPERCEPCRELKRAERAEVKAAKARKRMADLRATRRAERDALVVKAGLPTPRQGVKIDATEELRALAVDQEPWFSPELQAAQRGVYVPWE
jgi:hypothetical protein